MSKTGNEPAFPASRTQTGLTKREWFAGMALAAIRIPGGRVDQFVVTAFAIADAMIAEGAKQ